MSIYAEHKHSANRIIELEFEIRQLEEQLEVKKKELQANKDLYADSLMAMRDEARREKDDWRYHDE